MKLGINAYERCFHSSSADRHLSVLDDRPAFMKMQQAGKVSAAVGKENLHGLGLCHAVALFAILISACQLVSLSAFAAATPTPTPTPVSVIIPTSTVRFYWSAPPLITGVPVPTSYDFLEKMGTDNYKLLGSPKASTPYFDVKNIGTKARTFAVRARTKDGAGAVTEVTFPGMVSGSKFYLEVQIK